MNPPTAFSVAVTGVGMISPLGEDVATSWKNLLEGRTARQPVSLFDVSGCKCHDGAEVGTPLSDGGGRLPRASLLAIAAAREALQQSRLLDAEGRSAITDLPLSVSTTGGGMSFGEEFLRRTLAGKTRDRLRYAARYQPQQQILDLQEVFSLRGPSTIIANACASGANAIGHAADLIRAGKTRCVLAGGFEALTELIFVGFDCLQALSPDCCRPFDEKRNGLMLGEGAGFLVLEEAETARQRGADILCFVSGYGHATDLYHLTQPHPEGQALIGAMQAALQRAEICSGDVAYINSHGTATPMNDGAEVNAYLGIFGEKLPVVSSTKSAIGHTLGAAGTIEAIFAIQALREGVAPPQINCGTAIPQIASSLAAMDARLDGALHVMSVNLGFGGSNAALVFSKEERRRPGEVSRKFRASVAGMGAVSPQGCGIEKLLVREPVSIQRVDLLSSPEKSVPAYHVAPDDDHLARWRKHPRLRRVSPITLFMAEAASQATAGLSDEAKLRTGIVAAFSTGSNIFSRRFFTDILTQGQSFASPALFPETVFNSPTSHIAAVLGVGGACYSIVGDETAWCEALKVAALWLETGLVDHALVIGAEELDPITLEAYVASGWLTPHSTPKEFIPSEGASALLLHRSTEGILIEIPAGAYPYRTPAAGKAALKNCLDDASAGYGWAGTSSHSWIASSLERNERLPYLGEAFTAAAGWETLRALQALDGKAVTVPIPGLNQAVSRLNLSEGQ